MILNRTIWPSSSCTNLGRPLADWRLNCAAFVHKVEPSCAGRRPRQSGTSQRKHTPLDLYATLYQSRAKPVVLDDLDGLLRDPSNTALLKCLCDTTHVKRVEWGNYNRAFSRKRNRLPKSFDSISRVCLLANDLGVLNANISAVQDRGLLLLFQPDAVEVHREVARGGWFGDEEVFDFLGQHLFLVARPSFRLYLTAQSQKVGPGLERVSPSHAGHREQPETGAGRAPPGPVPFRSGVGAGVGAGTRLPVADMGRGFIVVGGGAV